MRIRALIVACLIAISGLLIATPAQAAPATVYIYKVYFDSPGSDRGSNSSLNAEYVVIRNGDNVSHSVSGWTVRDAAGHGYTFPGGFRLGAGKQAIIHTGDGTKYTTSASTHLYWGREWYVEQQRRQSDLATCRRVTEGHLLL
jgi:lamin tail-like protein